MTTVLVAGRHRRTTLPGRVPTDRNTAHCQCPRVVHWCNNHATWECGTGKQPSDPSCPRHMPKPYATAFAKHRSDRS
jgi:hypothetical protein